MLSPSFNSISVSSSSQIQCIHKDDLTCFPAPRASHLIFFLIAFLHFGFVTETSTTGTTYKSHCSAVGTARIFLSVARDAGRLSVVALMPGLCRVNLERPCPLPFRAEFLNPHSKEISTLTFGIRTFCKDYLCLYFRRLHVPTPVQPLFLPHSAGYMINCIAFSLHFTTFSCITQGFLSNPLANP